ncbi:2-oxoglutarate dehydrogenase complex dihydrolipoyllysine-residue succinyltransferase [Wenzhouxiangella sp. XN24]|uniref:2-oxoglutarate dehydrogenase complex dihydrolipoyllysine-residue succinyltransferase n=1 Tax=Wenzhouxiangella sp. XN24 TaxID=2713569 RepID=UPI0013EAFFE2|nr:2-oxoglutarate dehydrogenase complex dihydrolipoyllysine-residue succinyltransferase [Wenzhouxiangella sp. XN24]NGX16660.1 2-oxoglutarate dehydrogenase complex dihydrolipoyllysine-residue succinyltransferase [Wenzhouxiangella sp. XN24]
MSMEVKVPQLPESVADATLVAWHKSPGDRVSRDENLADLETDKVVLEVPAPADGVLKEIRISDGTTVTAGEILAILEEGEAGGKAETAAPAAAAGAASADDAAGAATDEEEGDEGEETPGKAAGRLSPSVRRLVDEHGLDPADIRGSGRDGRITKADVMDFLERPAGKPGAGEAAAAPSKPGAAARGAREERRIPMTRMRTRIAERLVEAQATAAMLTSFNEVDLGAVMDIRKRYRDSFEKKHGVRIGFMSFFVKAAIEALRKFPVVNASVEGSDLIYHDYYDIGVAVSTDRGLMVPVLRDADVMSFADIERNIGEYAARARDGKIGVDDLTGGTFTITNGGVFGSLMSTPIINPPQSAILGMHKIQDRAMVVDGEIRVRPMMYIALTYDHRIIDGREAVQFLVSVKESLEDPARLLIQL